MKCPKCDARLPDGYRFCYKCGTMFAFPGETPEESVRLAKEQYQKYVQYVRAQQSQQEQQPQPSQQPQQAAAPQPQQTAPEQQPAQQADFFTQLSRQQVSPASQARQASEQVGLGAQGNPQQVQPEQSLAQYYQQQQVQPSPYQAQQQAHQPGLPPQRVGYAASVYPSAGAESRKTTSGAAITAFVLGIVALTTSFLPIINNASFFVALVGFVFAIVGIAATKKNKPKKGRGFAVAALLINVIAVALVFFTQSLFLAAFNSALEGPKPVTTGSQQGSGQADYSAMEIGQSVTLENGITITVKNVRKGLENYGGSPVTEVTVVYSNGGKTNANFNMFDWKSESANGVIESATIYTQGENDLSSGQLAPGGTVEGNVYFEGEAAKVYYYSNIVQSESHICWIVP